MNWMADLADLAIGTQCAGCRQPALGLCDGCLHAIRPSPRIVREHPCRIAAAGEYDGVLRAALIAWKERGRFSVERPLGHLLAVSVMALGADGSLSLVPIPSRSDRRRARGADVIADVARTSARLLRAVGVDARVESALSLTRRVRDQAGLSADARAKNIHGSMALRTRPRGDIVLVDDIVTTGATLSEAARVLTLTGLPVVGAAVVACTPLHS